jgi:hypothetical protein
VRHGDLVVGTHGRAFWVIDDVSPLRQFDAVGSAAALVLLSPRPAVRLNAAPFQGSPEPKDEPMAQNPPSGAILDYEVNGEARAPLILEILDAKGGAVRRYSSDDEAPKPPDPAQIVTTADWVKVPDTLAATPGMHRFVWDLRYAKPEELVRRRRGARDAAGPLAPPGRYTVRLSRGGEVKTQTLLVTRDPRLPATVTDADLGRQLELVLDVQRARGRIARALLEAATLRKQIAEVRKKPLGDAASALDTFARAVDEAAGPPVQNPGEEFGDEGDAAPTSLRKLSSSLASLQSAIESADAAPTADARTGFLERSKLAESGLARWRELVDVERPKLDKILAAAGSPALRTE